MTGFRVSAGRSAAGLPLLQVQVAAPTTNDLAHVQRLRVCANHERFSTQVRFLSHVIHALRPEIVAGGLYCHLLNLTYVPRKSVSSSPCPHPVSKLGSVQTLATMSRLGHLLEPRHQ